MSDDYEHALGGLRGHIVYGEQTAGDTPVEWMQVKVALPYLRDAERALIAERQRANAAEAEVATSRALADALRADNERLRAIVAGRSDAPTPQEIDAHAATGGRWLLTLAPTVRDAAPVEAVVMRAGERWLPGVIVRWHRLGADGALLTPTVTP